MLSGEGRLPGEWFEFTMGNIDGRELAVIFQMDLESEFFVNVPIRSIRDERT